MKKLLIVDKVTTKALVNGDIILVKNSIGACLAGVETDSAIRRGVVQLATEAWFDPQDIPGVGRICVHGNPNVLIADQGSSKLSQGSSAQLGVVSISRWEGAIPEKTVDKPPKLV